MRLKGGDPFVFGRGGEEALVCAEAGIPFSVVPGITAGVAAPAYAGVPVTHRELASGVAFVTGHENPEKPETALDWPALAAFPGTLVFYMGVRALPRIASQLVAGGRAADEPVAVVEQGTLPGQRTLLATLGDVAERAAAEADPRAGDHARRAGGGAARAARVARGAAAARPERDGDARAAAGERRSPRGCASWARRWSRRRRSGSSRWRPRCPPLDGFDLVCVTSPNGAHELWARLDAAGLDARALAGARLAAIGPGTARALLEHGLRADVVPARAVAEGLVEALADVPVRRALLVRGREGRDVLPDALRARGAEVEVLVLYETVAEPIARRGARARGGLRDVHVGVDRAVLPGRRGRDALRPDRLDRAGDLARRSARPGSSRTWRPTPHTPDGLVAALVADARG